MYRIQDENVERFLLARPELVKILNKGVPHIERIFGKDTVVELEHPVYREPDGDQNVFVVVRTHLDPEAAWDAEHRLWDDWFTKTLADPNARPLIIDVRSADDAPVL